MICVLCNDTGYRGLNAYQMPVPCECRTKKSLEDSLGLADAGLTATVAHQPMASVVRLRPGDRIVLHHPGVLSAAACAKIAEQFRGWLGRVDVNIVVLEEGMRLTVLSADGPEPDAAVMTKGGNDEPA